MRRHDVARHGGAHLGIERPVEPEHLCAIDAERGKPLAHQASHGRARETGGAHLQADVDHGFEEWPVQRPCGPARGCPIDRLGDPADIVGLARAVVRELCFLARGQHLERHHGPAPAGREATDDAGLKAVMVGVVVLLAEQHERRATETHDEFVPLDEGGGGDVPDAPDQGMIAPDRSLPRPATRACRGQPGQRRGQPAAHQA